MDEYQSPKHRDEEGQRETAWGHQSMKGEDVDDNRRENGKRQGHVPIRQKKHPTDHLKRENESEVMGAKQGSHELSRDATWWWERNEVQETIQAEDQEDHS